MSELISRQEYLKRYLEGCKKRKSKKKKHSNIHKQSRFKIVDEDIDLKKIEVPNDDDDEVGEEAPLVAGVIDERPEHVKINEIYSSTRWKKLGNSPTDNSKTRTPDLSHNMFVHSDSDKEERKHNTNKDFSPPRVKSAKLSSAALWKASESKHPPKRRHDSSSDESPPRAKTSKKSDSDLSPSRSKMDSRRHKHRDFSPTRKNAKHSSESSSESFRKHRSKVKHNSDEDFSPPRETASRVDKRYISDRDSQTKNKHSEYSRSSKTLQHSPPLKRLHSKKKSRRYDSDGDSSPPREKPHNSSEKKNVPYSFHGSSQSPIHSEKSHRRKEKSHSETMSSRDSEPKRSRPTSTLSGLKAGLQDSATLREETHNRKRREQMAINELSDELSGRNAETIARDKHTGQKRNLKEERLRQKEEEKEKAEKAEKYFEWGKGLKQKSDQHKRLQEDMYEMSKPLARYADDEDLERELKDELRGGDPMLEYMQRKRQKMQPNTPSLPMYQGPPAPPNRFNIPPGYRWDGVDRSNGYEKKVFEKVNSAKAKERESYLWSVENM